MSVDWDYLWAAPHKTATALARGHRVFAFDTVGFSRRLPRISDFSRLVNRSRRMMKPLVDSERRLHKLSLPVFPYLGFPGAEDLSGWMQIQGLRHILKTYAVKKPLFWTCLATRNILKLHQQMPECPLIYECLDDFSSYRGVPPDFSRAEREVAERAAVVFTCSEKQYALKSVWNKNTFRTPNASDPAHFNKAFDPALPVPADIAGLKRPVVGFIGSFDHWVDLELIRWLARHFPEISWVMIGPFDAVGGNPAGELRNLHFLGRRDYTTLPGYMKGMDIFILPFKSAGHMDSADPIILLDALAAGKPVLATDFPAARDQITAGVKIAPDADSMARLIGNAWEDLQDPVRAQEHARARAQSVKDRTWENRTQFQIETVERILNSATAPHGTSA